MSNEHFDEQYKWLVWDVLNNGRLKPSRAGDTLSIAGASMKVDLSQGYPLMTTKFVPWRLPIAEQLWFLEGGTTVDQLKAIEPKATFWDKWAGFQGEPGYLGRVYGAQHVDWKRYLAFWNEGQRAVEYRQQTINQVQNVFDELKANPFSRRLLVSAWNPAELDEMVLPPCPYAYQLVVEPELDGQPPVLHMVATWRSVDVGIGLPFDVAGFAALQHMYARNAGMIVGDLTCHFADCHVYVEHVEALKEQLQRNPYPLPKLGIHFEAPDGMFGWKVDHFDVSGYQSHPHIKMEVKV